MEIKQRTNIAFLLGVMPRSGTNYIFRAILHHPLIDKVVPPGEDYLLYGSNYLWEFIDKVQSKWSNNWEGMDRLKYRQRLVNSLQSGLAQYLLPKNESYKEGKYFFTKTPRTDNLNTFKELFPDSKLIIVVRDGKQIVTSGVKSFKWTYIKSMKEYSESLQRIIAFINHNPPESYCVVKYEKFCQNPELEIKKILNYLELDVNLYDFSLISEMPVLGSSNEVNDQTGDFEWKVVEKTKVKPYKPIKWHPLLFWRYRQICGNFTSFFGYEDNDYQAQYSMKSMGKYFRAELRQLKIKLFYR